MMNKNERMEKLNQAGINTSKYFTVDLENGTKIHLIVDENGQFKQIEKDAIAEQIIADGYVRNTKLHRRFVMAQMFHMLNYTSNNGRESGFNACLKNMYGYDYTFTMMLEEVKVLSKLEERDADSFMERSNFFTKDVVVNVVCDYIEKLMVYVNSIPNQNCKGVPYKKIKGKDIFVDDLGKKLYKPLKNKVKRIMLAPNYTVLYKYLQDFMKDMVKLPYNTTKSKAWIDAYKGEGAYYTLKNLIMFHDCVIEYGNKVLTQKESMQELARNLVEYRGEGWRMFALMKKVIADNNFDFNRRMEELGVY